MLQNTANYKMRNVKWKKIFTKWLETHSMYNLLYKKQTQFTCSHNLYLFTSKHQFLHMNPYRITTQKNINIINSLEWEKWGQDMQHTLEKYSENFGW
jgi:hypothetical protein